MNPWVRWLGAGIVLLALVGVFMAYQNPHTVMDLANRVWACF